RRASPTPVEGNVSSDPFKSNSPSSGNQPELFTRIFKSDPEGFKESLMEIGARIGSDAASGSSPVRPGDTEKAVREFFAQVGVSLIPPRALFWNDREGALSVRATSREFDVIEASLQVLITPPPLVQI